MHMVKFTCKPDSDSHAMLKFTLPDAHGKVYM